MIKVYNNTFISESGNLITGNSLNNNKIEGVYLLFDSEENLIYVGQSNNISRRLINHSRNKNKNWSYSYVIPIDYQQHRLFTESILIKYLKPKNNTALGYPKEYGYGIHDICKLEYRLNQAIEQVSFISNIYWDKKLNINEL